MIDISIIIPAYKSNFQNLFIQINTIKKIFKQKNYEILIIFDDNNLKNKIFDKFKNLKNNLRIYQNYQNYGQQITIRNAFKLARGNILITIDDDYKYDLKSLKSALYYFNKNDAFINWKNK